MLGTPPCATHPGADLWPGPACIPSLGRAPVLSDLRSISHRKARKGNRGDPRTQRALAEGPRALE